MDMHELDFVRVIVLRDDIAEVIFNEGARLTSPMVDEYHRLLSSLLRAPFSLLINKKNKYSYDTLARWKLGTFKAKAFAIVAYDEESKAQTENTTFVLPKEEMWNMRFFSDRDQALEWLISEQATVKPSM